MGLYTYFLKVVKKMKAKALTSFFSKEHGSVSIGDTMNFQNQETMQGYVNAGYVEEMSDDMAIPTETVATEAPKATKSARRTKASAPAPATSDVEFSSELGATNAQNVNEALAHEAQVAKNANEMNDMNENNK